MDHFEQQRQEYNAKIDRLQADGLEKDRQLAAHSLKLERLSDELERKRQELEQTRGQAERDRKALADKLEATKRKLAEAQDEAMRQKLDFGREQALAKQQVG